MLISCLDRKGSSSCPPPVRRTPSGCGRRRRCACRTPWGGRNRRWAMTGPGWSRRRNYWWLHAFSFFLSFLPSYLLSVFLSFSHFPCCQSLSSSDFLCFPCLPTLASLFLLHAVRLFLCFTITHNLRCPYLQCFITNIHNCFTGSHYSWSRPHGTHHI